MVLDDGTAKGIRQLRRKSVERMISDQLDKTPEGQGCGIRSAVLTVLRRQDLGGGG